MPQLAAAITQELAGCSLQSGFNTGLSGGRPFLSSPGHRPQTTTALRLQAGDGAVCPLGQGAGLAQAQDRACGRHCPAPGRGHSPAAHSTTAGKSTCDCSRTQRLLGTRSLLCHHREQDVLLPLPRGRFPSPGVVGAPLPQQQLLLRAGGCPTSLSENGHLNWD